MNSVLFLIGRDQKLFTADLEKHSIEIDEIVTASRFLVLGGAGSIGQAVTREIFKRNPRKLHIVDLSENNLVELVRDLRSSSGYMSGDFQSFALDIGSLEYDAFIATDGHYDFVLNLSAMKHVRSERDPFTLMRMVDVNVTNTDKTIQQMIPRDTRKYFCVSTDKAANPVNMMGASKRIMEMFLMRRSQDIDISTSRFANVAFSDGSLMHGFNQRLLKMQPIVAPKDVRRYFITAEESGELCLMSCLLGENRDIFFPKLSPRLHLMSFADIAVRYLQQRGYEPFVCDSEDEARALAKESRGSKQWPCLFTASDTTGEKDFEEFYTDAESVDTSRFESIGIVKNDAIYDNKLLDHFESRIAEIRQCNAWSKQQLVDLFHTLLPEFRHVEVGRHLDQKM